MSKNVKETWNRFARLINLAAKAWEEHRELYLTTSTAELERLPIEFQRFLTKNFNKAKFDVMLPRLIDYWRSSGGVGILKVPEEKTKEEKKDE